LFSTTSSTSIRATLLRFVSALPDLGIGNRAQIRTNDISVAAYEAVTGSAELRLTRTVLPR
jgi:hypothetical protein